MRSVLQGIEPSADVAAILVVYFVQGALGLARLSTTFYLKDDLHLSAAEVAALGGVITLPWLVKPLYGFVTDSYPFLGYRRRSYLAAAGAVAIKGASRILRRRLEHRLAPSEGGGGERRGRV